LRQISTRAGADRIVRGTKPPDRPWWGADSLDQVASSISEHVRAAILAGDYAPRQRLIEADLCEQFGASRLLVRTALQHLAGQGLIEFRRYRGAQVRDVSLRDAIEITNIRSLLEVFTAARAAERITPSQGSELRQIVKDMRDAVASGALTHYSELDARLHSALRQIAAHSISGQMLEQLRALTARHELALLLRSGWSSLSLAQHEAIAMAVASGDSPAAEEAMRAHLQSVLDALGTPSAAATSPLSLDSSPKS
jgi:DNA-binding GntR family transcriptional regulator